MACRSVITYYPVGLAPEASRFFFFLFMLFLLHSMVRLFHPALPNQAMKLTGNSTSWDRNKVRCWDKVSQMKRFDWRSPSSSCILTIWTVAGDAGYCHVPVHRIHLPQRDGGVHGRVLLLPGAAASGRLPACAGRHPRLVDLVLLVSLSPTSPCQYILGI